ncbi:MAG: complex I NDUFA9 subunit family protein [Rhodocyclales bacterium]|nr:complex I NDUFA9 subunit family protein [Rhodocyclales bacterium]
MNILLIGGSGFVGGHLAAHLSAGGHSVLIPTRRRERAKHLTVLPTVDVVEADVHDEAQLAALMRHRDAVINLVGVLRGGNGDPYGAGFARAHVELPRKIVRAVQNCGVPRLLHMSALGADPRAPSAYLRSKADGEAAAFAVSPAVGVTVFRPSVIFGRGDSFLTLFARLLRRLPIVPLACPDARFQPVWVEDVAAAFCASLPRRESFGPMEFLPGAPLTRDNVRSMQVPSVCDNVDGLPFALSATPLETVAPSYLAQPT